LQQYYPVTALLGGVIIIALGMPRTESRRAEEGRVGQEQTVGMECNRNFGAESRFLCHLPRHWEDVVEVAGSLVQALRAVSQGHRRALELCVCSQCPGGTLQHSHWDLAA
jgi:hypothetical protein